MQRKILYKSINQLGIDIWHPRLRKNVGLVTNNIRIYARCLVLSYFISTDIAISDAEKKIFTGMLSVLNLDNSQIMHATIYGPNPDLALLETYIHQWQPEFILQLGMELPFEGHNFVQTFSPAYLLQNQQYKVQAHKTLLNLRAMLHAK